MTKRIRIDSHGFTLIEIMVVIIILGILAVYIGPKIMGRPEEARRTKAKVGSSIRAGRRNPQAIHNVWDVCRGSITKRYRWITAIDLNDKAGVWQTVKQIRPTTVGESASDGQVIGIDNVNDYYDVNIKLARLERVAAMGNFTPVEE